MDSCNINSSYYCKNTKRNQSRRYCDYGNNCCNFEFIMCEGETGATGATGSTGNGVSSFENSTMTVVKLS